MRLDKINLALAVTFLILILCLPVASNSAGLKLAPSQNKTLDQTPDSKKKKVFIRPSKQIYTRTPGSLELVILDLRGDGINLSGTAVVSIAGKSSRYRWTKPNSDDAWLIVDVGTLGQLGWLVKHANGIQAEGRILISDGLIITDPGGKVSYINDRVEFLHILDKNKDGMLDSRDQTWRSLSLFADQNGDGQIEGAEISSLADNGVRALFPRLHSSRKDSHGNTLWDFTFTNSTGLTRVAANVRLKPM
ncbi:MAG: hypothetical protein GY935_13465 [Gammaproteobacteria bacterium]|nr:hypothetical protein [Gammaproteobacteria bacterium]